MEIGAARPILVRLASGWMLITSLHHCRIRGEDTCQQVSLEEHQCKSETPHQKSDANAGEHGLLRPLLLSGTYIL